MARADCLELARTLGVDPDLLVEEWSERAAIREYEGGQSRADAERDALDDVRMAHRRGPKSVGAARELKKAIDQ